MIGCFSVAFIDFCDNLKQDTCIEKNRIPTVRCLTAAGDFFAGDENDEYVNDPDNIGLYSLNTIANYDKDIIVDE